MVKIVYIKIQKNVIIANKMLVHRINKDIFKKAWVWFILYILLFRVETVFGALVDSDPCPDNELCPPTVARDIPSLLKALVDILIKIGIPLAALAIIYAGFLFVTAGGSEEKVKKAKKTFMYTIIGTAILLGAWVIISAISDTLIEIDPGS
jgi:hypothetical protein